mgnify:CR=1 FL=1
MARPRHQVEHTECFQELAAAGMCDARIHEEGYARMFPEEAAGLHWGLYNAADILGGCEKDGSAEGPEGN